MDGVAGGNGDAIAPFGVVGKWRNFGKIQGVLHQYFKNFGKDRAWQSVAVLIAEMIWHGGIIAVQQSAESAAAEQGATVGGCEQSGPLGFAVLCVERNEAVKYSGAGLGEVDTEGAFILGAVADADALSVEAGACGQRDEGGKAHGDGGIGGVTTEVEYLLSGLETRLVRSQQIGTAEGRETVGQIKEIRALRASCEAETKCS